MQPLSNYREALNYIYSHTNFERKQMPKYNMTVLDLSRVKTLLTQIDNPHHQYPVLLIAGTKGKGSTSAMCDSILRAAGYKTGFYSSPHIHTFRERIRVNGALITENEVISLVNDLRPHFDTIFGLTAWEIMTTMAFVTFSQANIDVAVLEVGLGGRLDATNVTNPSVSVITSISYDHTHLLGNTLTLIAREKAGIIRQKGVVVSAPQFPEAMTEIQNICEEKAARLIVAGSEMPWRLGHVTLKEQIIYINNQPYIIPLLGQHQATNAITALTAINALQEKLSLNIPLEAKKTGLANVEWPGRLEILSRSPFILVDSAMNGDSVRKLRQTLKDYFPGRNVILIFGVSRDHDYTTMLTELLPIAHHTIATQANHPRATRPDVLTAIAQTLGYTIASSSSVEDALTQALSQVDERNLICVTGSLFCVADARLAWMQQNRLPLPETDPI